MLPAVNIREHRDSEAEENLLYDSSIFHTLLLFLVCSISFVVSVMLLNMPNYPVMYLLPERLRYSNMHGSVFT